MSAAVSNYRPRRSVLYMPSSNERAVAKAATIPCDAVIFDLEDAVAPDAKVEARARACDAVANGDYGARELTIRCNGLDTPWGAGDLDDAAAARPSAVVVPKVSSVAEVDAVVARLDAAGATDVAVWPMIETPDAVLVTRDIASHSRVEVLVLGTNDLISELRAQRVAGRAPLVPHLAQVLLAGRAAGVVVLDGVYNDVRDADGFAAEARQGFEMGFDGKTLVHPSQVDPTNDIWAPSDADVEHAREVIAAFEAAEAEGTGVITVNGRMIENLHVAEAHRTLAIHAAVTSA